jgi:dipeptidyl aminopeptidase/acylaminoacyl peptidase
MEILVIHRIARLAVLFVEVVSFCAVLQSPAQDRRPFTVKESIEMSTFSDPDTRVPNAECKISPDRKHFFAITTKGTLLTNRLTSTLWIYSAPEVEKYLRGRGGLPPKPQLLLTVDRVPVARQNDSYGSLITNAQWSSDSQSILSLIEQSGGNRHLFRTYLNGHRSVDLTSGDQDVTNFGEAAGTISFVVQEHLSPPRMVGKPLNATSSDLTGSSMFQVFFPKRFPDPTSFWPKFDLWVRYKGTNRKVTARGNWHFPIMAWEEGFRISVAPNGKSLIAARPVPDIPEAWSDYALARSVPVFSREHLGTDRSGRAVSWPWQYIYVNLEDMAITPLVNAPVGDIEGYPDAVQAVWFPDGENVLFTNSYLPISNHPDSLSAEGNVPCAAAVYTVATTSVSCVARVHPPKERHSLRSATFGISSDEVILRWSGDSANSTDVYKKIQQQWVSQPQTAISNETQPTLRVSVRQDINEYPTLWAGEPGGASAKKLWNPNPQLDSIELGSASVYSWKDSTGYSWHGGLLLPPNYERGRRYPLVIQTHGFANAHEFLVDGSYTSGFAARALAAVGIVVLQVEDRADRHITPPDQEAQLGGLGFSSAIEQLNKDGVIDSSNVGIIGFSRTHWLVEEALIHQPSLYRAAELVDGVDQSYMTYMLFSPNWPDGTAMGAESNGGRPFGKGLESWVKNAAGFNLDKVQAPVRIEAHGDLSLLQEWEIYSSLYQQSKPVDFEYLPDAPHILQQPQQRYDSQQGTVDWFRFWLQGYERPNPEDLDQYKRWEHLRELQDAAGKAGSLPATAKPN